MLGSLKIPLRGKKHFVVFGGPYPDKPAAMRGVKMAAEINLPCDVNVPTRDFSIPDYKLMLQGLSKAVDLVLAGEPVYVGCMGGKGRTGLFLAILCKTFGVRNSIKYVRKNYYSHAVETSEQMKYVRGFKIPPQIFIKIKKVRKSARWKYPFKTNLTRVPGQIPVASTVVKDAFYVLKDIFWPAEWVRRSQKNKESV